MGYSTEEKDAIFRNAFAAARLSKIEDLAKHPNYRLPTPMDGETEIQFALRCASHLVSPPQEPHESYEVECVTLRDGILALETDVSKKWKEFTQKRNESKDDYTIGDIEFDEDYR